MAESLADLARTLVSLSLEKGLSLCTAESCTGGMIAESITSVPGSSAVFLGALVTYDERMKHAWLSVSEQTLASVGAVSAPCAAEMAEGAKKASGASLALSVTGFAGPTGGNARDGVGTVYFGISSSEKTAVVRRVFEGDRTAVRRAATEEALRLLTEAVKCI